MDHKRAKTDFAGVQADDPRETVARLWADNRYDDAVDAGPFAAFPVDMRFMLTQAYCSIADRAAQVWKHLSGARQVVLARKLEQACADSIVAHDPKTAFFCLGVPLCNPVLLVQAPRRVQPREQWVCRGGIGYCGRKNKAARKRCRDCNVSGGAAQVEALRRSGLHAAPVKRTLLEIAVEYGEVDVCRGLLAHTSLLAGSINQTLGTNILIMAMSQLPDDGHPDLAAAAHSPEDAPASGDTPAVTLYDRRKIIFGDLLASAKAWSPELNPVGRVLERGFVAAQCGFAEATAQPYVVPMHGTKETTLTAALQLRHPDHRLFFASALIQYCTQGPVPRENPIPYAHAFVRTCNTAGMTPVSIALVHVLKDGLELVNLLLDHGADLDALSTVDRNAPQFTHGGLDVQAVINQAHPTRQLDPQYRLTPLSMACRSGELWLADDLIVQGATVDYAYASSHPMKITELMQACGGSDVHIASYDDAPLLRYNVIRVLLDKGAVPSGECIRRLFSCPTFLQSRGDGMMTIGKVTRVVDWILTAGAARGFSNGLRDPMQGNHHLYCVEIVRALLGAMVDPDNVLFYKQSTVGELKDLVKMMFKRRETVDTEDGRPESLLHCSVDDLELLLQEEATEGKTRLQQLWYVCQTLTEVATRGPAVGGGRAGGN